MAIVGNIVLISRKYTIHDMNIYVHIYIFKNYIHKYLEEPLEIPMTRTYGKYIEAHYFRYPDLDRVLTIM